MKRYNIVFKVVPMMNPDGVVMGNYRTGILGEDFNRKFLSSKDILYP
jgi:murein tripeptide amidase MpaA